ELMGGRCDAYEVGGGGGQDVKVVIDQRGIDVVVSLLGPDNKQIAEFDFERRPNGQESVLLVAETAGSYRLDVLARQKNAPPGRYEIQMVERHQATENDRDLYQARKLYQESINLLQARKFNEAKRLVEQVLETSERILGPDHLDVAAAVNSLAVLNSFTGEHAKSEPLYQRALAIKEKALGPEHIEVSFALNNLAMIYLNKGEYAKAETLYERSIAIRQKT